MSESAKISTSNAMLSVYPNQHTKHHKTFAKTKEQITFPFVCLYGGVTELSGEVKEK